MNIHFSYYEIAKHHLTKMHTWFNLYYSILLAKFCQKLKEHITEKITALHGYSLSLIITWSKYKVPLQMKYH